MRLEEMKNNIPETPDFIHKMVQEEVSRQLQDTKVVPMKKRKWNKVQAAAAAALCLLATSTVAYAGNRLYHMYVEKQGNYRVETGIQADAGTSVQLPEQIHEPLDGGGVCHGHCIADHHDGGEGGRGCGAGRADPGAAGPRAGW